MSAEGWNSIDFYNKTSQCLNKILEMYLKYFQHGYVFNDPIKPIWGNTVSEIVFKLNHTELSTLLSISCFRSSPSTWRTSAVVLSTWQYLVSLGPASLPRKCKLAALAFTCKHSIRLILIHKLWAFPSIYQMFGDKLLPPKFENENSTNKIHFQTPLKLK